MATRIPENTATLALSDIAHALGVSVSGTRDCVVRGVTTDSRANVAGKLFVALSGEHFDGHDYLQDVSSRGAAALLVEREPAVPVSVPVVKVGSTLSALGDIAALHRNRWRGKLVAIAGAAGKTTTRVACQALFEAAYPERVHCTLGNLNNQIGVPMTLLGLKDTDDVAIVEIGTNSLGEVPRLATLCKPDISILTLIGLEHSEGLGDLDSIEREEGEIFRPLGSKGVAIGNGDDARIVRQMLERAPSSRQLTYGLTANVDYSISYQLSENLDRTLITIHRSQRVGGGRLQFDSTLLAMPGALAATAAVVAVESMGTPIEGSLVTAALGREQLGEDGRMRFTKLEGEIIVLDDSYNANPPSMASSVAVARKIAQKRQARLIAVLGEMRELGRLSEREHRNLGTLLDGVSMLAAVGTQAKPLFESARDAGISSLYFDNSDVAASRMTALVQPGDVVLVKGSRGVNLETVVRQLVSQKGLAA
jgi:UDP-N-acetylmuramoyl-tripeptide--D-alanyl-D-alanine ligase